MSNNVKKREIWLDSLRGFAIVLVVLGHMADSFVRLLPWGENNPILCSIYNFAYAFHMPFMFLISGYAFALAYVRSEKVNISKVRNAIVQFVLIYLIWSVILILQDVVLELLLPGVFEANYHISQILTLVYRSVGSYWYLYALVLLYLVATLLFHFKIPFRFSLAVSALICLFYPTQFYEFSVPYYPRYAFYFLLGIYFHLHPKKYNPHILHMINILGIAYWGYAIYLGLHQIRFSGSLSIDILSPIGAFCISFMLMKTAPTLLKKEPVFSLIGRYSMDIFLLHAFLLSAVRILLLRLGIDGMIPHLISSVCAIGIPIALAILLKRIKLYEPFFRPYAFWLQIKAKIKRTV